MALDNQVLNSELGSESKKSSLAGVNVNSDVVLMFVVNDLAGGVVLVVEVESVRHDDGSRR